MASNTEIANLALAHIGVGKSISSLDNDSTQEALACRVFYALSLKQCLRDFNWPFATKFDDLGLVEEDPTNEWAFSYRYPSDCINLRRILSGTRTDTPDTRTPYKLGQDSEGLLIYTDMTDAQVEYTLYANTPEFYPADFELALSYLLAFNIAARLTGGDPFKIRSEVGALYDRAVGAAAANARNEEQADVTPDSEFIRTRNS